MLSSATWRREVVRFLRQFDERAFCYMWWDVRLECGRTRCGSSRCPLRRLWCVYAPLNNWSYTYYRDGRLQLGRGFVRDTVLEVCRRFLLTLNNADRSSNVDLALSAKACKAGVECSRAGTYMLPAICMACGHRHAAC